VEIATSFLAMPAAVATKKGTHKEWLAQQALIKSKRTIVTLGT
jgi:hypothetical protein